MRCPEECGKQQRPKQGKLRQEKQKKKEEKKQEEKEQKKKEKKPKRERIIEVKKMAEEWEIWDEEEEEEEETRKIVSEHFHKWIHIFSKKTSERIYC